MSLLTKKTVTVCTNARHWALAAQGRYELDTTMDILAAGQLC